MTDCKLVSTPLEPGKEYTKLSSDSDKWFDKKEYQTAIGSLNYAMNATRPDIYSAVSILSQFMSNPASDH